MERIDIRSAILEAIYWWNRDESYYHRFFSNLREISTNEQELEFFTVKIFEVFLREYSIRRNLYSSYAIVDKLLEELLRFGFVERVKAGETDVVDELSIRLKEAREITDRQTISLLSKVAFLINPLKFSIYDSLAKESLWEINKNSKKYKKSHTDSYKGFLEQINELINHYKQLIEQESEVLKEFKGTSAIDYFSKNSEAFNRRVIDKFLWIRSQNKNNLSRRINNEPYLSLIKL